MSRHRSVSKTLSWILRHEAERLGLAMDPEGFVHLDDVVVAVNTHSALAVTVDELRSVVAEADPVKQRFAIVEDCIRANYGHSLDGDVSHPAAEPPALLLHGTSVGRVPVILAEGLKPMARQYVHLTPNEKLALSVGIRHGQARVLRIRAVEAHRSGVRFLRANEQFWLTKAVPPAFVDC